MWGLTGLLRLLGQLSIVSPDTIWGGKLETSNLDRVANADFYVGKKGKRKGTEGNVK